MEKGFYHPNLGYWQTNAAPSEEVIQGYPEGTVEVGLMPSPLHQLVDGVWVPPTQAELDAQAAENIRAERDAKLANEVDPLVTNPLRWGDLTAEKQAEWAAYRTALLDITGQAGFPDNVTWPVAPTDG